jgi:hypothetical protein
MLMGNLAGDIDGFSDDLLVTYVIDEEQKESRAHATATCIVETVI